MLKDLDVNQIMALLPHRPPFLFLERLQKVCAGQSAEGIKTVAMNEWFFAGHFPGHPVMPGVLLTEALAQTAGALAMYSMREEGSCVEDHLMYFMSVESARFRRPVVPGDVLSLRVEKLQSRGSIWRFSGKVFVQDTLMAESIFMAMLAARKEAPSKTSCA